MFPYKDDNPTERPSLVTAGLIAVNLLAWVFLQGMGFGDPLIRSVCEFGLIPGELLGTVPPGAGIELAPGKFCGVDPAPQYWTVVTSMFMHGGWFHLIGNMLFLWVFGNNIEDAMGHGKFLAFYLVCGTAAAAAQVLVSRESAVPMVGASGAVSGVLGAYLLLYPRVRVHTLIFLGFYATTAAIPAYIMLGYWAVLQLVGGIASLTVLDRGGVAFFAHLGGFVMGLVLVRFLVSDDVLQRRPVHPSGLYHPRH